MKIGIVTLWNTGSNYGGILQTFALQRYLRNQGHDAYVIRVLYSNSLWSKCKRIIKKLLIIFNVLSPSFSYSRLLITKERDRKRKFCNFLKHYVALSPMEYHSLFALKLFAPKADCYITGSDQVWAMPLSTVGEGFHYLDFGNKNTKRISYAASFGHDTFPEEDREQFKSYVSKFDKISVREESGRKICESMGFEAERCVDSTLLLNASDYIQLMSPRKHENPYVFIYSVNMSSSSEIYWKSLKGVIANHKLDVVATTASGFVPAKELFNEVIYDYATPSEWLSNIYYSELVITSSFHGIVFSILFRKQFAYFPLQSKYKSGNDRITDLLDLVGLRHRTVYSEIECQDIFKTAIDYNSIDYTAINKMIKRSKDYLIF